MSNKNLPGRALQIIYRYWVEHDQSYPTSGEIAQALGISGSHWANLRKAMFEKGLLVDSPGWGVELTDLGFSMMQANESKGDKIVGPRIPITNPELIPNVQSVLNPNRTNLAAAETFIEIMLVGEVKAGVGSREDDLAVYDNDNEVVSVPDTAGDPSKVFAMRVEGESMVHEGIYPGDYVIVEKVPLIRLQDGDLVIAKYLPNEYINKKVPEILEVASQPDNLHGPTLKYFSKLQRGDKRSVYRLSWKTEAETSEFKIDTPYISPDETGRVIAVYTPQRFRKLRSSKISA